MDIFPPAKQRHALLELVKALGCRDNALRRDECGDWRVEGRSGHIYAAPGSLGRPEAPGFQIYIAGSSRWWTAAKAAFAPFAEIANDGGDEGTHFIFRLPGADEAGMIRHYVGLAKKRELSEAELARLVSVGHPFAKRSDVEAAQTGEKTASTEAAGSLSVLAFEEEN
jgi:hypothetical protein